MIAVDYVRKRDIAFSSDTVSYAVECLDWQAAAVMRPGWELLASRALEPNIYMEAAFALTAAEHLVEEAKPDFLFVSANIGNGVDIRLIGIFPFIRPSAPDRFVSGWLPKQAALGTPLLDREYGAAALDQALHWIQARYPNVASICWRLLERHGPVASRIVEWANFKEMAVHCFDLGARAKLLIGTDVETMLRRIMSRKHRKYLHLGGRRLKALGVLTYNRHSEPEEMHQAIECFLALEASGWKGRRGTALQSRQASDAFARAMLKEQTALGKCYIDTLAIDGKPLAMGIALVTGHIAFLWKIAYDEAYADYSPGVQFMLEFSKQQASDDSIVMTDSCAIPGHPMFSKIWSDKKPVLDLYVSVCGHRRVAFKIAVLVETARRSLREWFKSVFYHVSGRRRT
jgi:CelD/BcsL family acetyltransferase involved in cellulose biosynthesis